MEANDLIELRKLMGTYQEDGSEKFPDNESRFIIGCKDIKVELVDWSVNPYKAMYIMATTCWGKKINKWRQTSPEHRFMVVKAVLEGQSLPLALEAPKFTFVIEGPSRSAFDQIARARIGAVFSAKGMRDNSWVNAKFRIPNAIANSLFKTAYGNLLYKDYTDALINSVRTYSKIVNLGRAHWQAARAILPMSVVYGWSMSMNYQALRGFCSRRMKFCEQEDTVATAWLMSLVLSKKFPLLADYLRPGCDFTGECNYHKTYYLAEVFSCLFKECGRNKCEATNEYAIFNESCSSRDTIAEQTGLFIPDVDDWQEYNWERLEDEDRKLFEED